MRASSGSGWQGLGLKVIWGVYRNYTWVHEGTIWGEGGVSFFGICFEMATFVSGIRRKPVSLSALDI